MPLLPIVAGAPGDQFVETTDKRGHPLGSRMYFADGREFAYCKAGTTALVAGNLNQQTLNDANFDELAVAAAAAVGDKTVTITTGATALTVDQAEDGYLNIEDDAGEGHVYTIKTHPAIATTTDGVITLYDPLQVALTTATTVLVFLNPFSTVIIHPSPPTAMIVGVSPHALAASNYGWLQRKGPAPILTDGTLIINQSVVASDAIDGAVEPGDAAITDGTPPTGHGELQPIGTVMEVAADTEYSLIYMNMP